MYKLIITAVACRVISEIPVAGEGATRGLSLKPETRQLSRMSWKDVHGYVWWACQQTDVGTIPIQTLRKTNPDKHTCQDSQKSWTRT